MDSERVRRHIAGRAARRIRVVSGAGLIVLVWLAGGRPGAEFVRAQSANPPRRVNIPYFTTDDLVSTGLWGQTAIFWFGKNELALPGKNHADVRVAYTPTYLQVRVTVIDYFLWHAVTDTGDLTQYDGAALYLDVQHDRASTPQMDDYMFLSGLRFSSDPSTKDYHRQARGTGAGWNATWNGMWTDQTRMQWDCNPGPNSNNCNPDPNPSAPEIDYGWWTYFYIPWSSLGLSGPPAAGTVWGMAIQLYDRDDSPPSGVVPPEFWPETFNANQPNTWGEVHFGNATYQPPSVAAAGSATIRANSPTDNRVEDAYVGGGPNCQGGHEGGSEINHGNDTGLFIGTETAPTHFPCFSKSFLRFSLSDIPPNKVILSATLTLHLWGNAGNPGEARPSWIHLFTIADDWDEMTIHWNNAPPAQQNVSAIWVNPYSHPQPIWPGDPYTWDATQAVAEAYAAGRPASIALYGADTDQHSNKYFTSSESGLGDPDPNWNIAGRPRLTVIWGNPQATVKKSVAPAAPKPGGTVTYTLNVAGSGQSLLLTDTLPSQVGAPLSLQASLGSALYNAGARRVTWNGSPASGQLVTITFPVTVANVGRMAVSNTVTLNEQGRLTTANAVFIVNAYQVWLPIVRK